MYTLDRSRGNVFITPYPPLPVILFCFNCVVDRKRIRLRQASPRRSLDQRDEYEIELTIVITCKRLA